MDENGLILKEATVVDSSMISVPSSTKNSEGKRNLVMCQTKKCSQWHFGMKAHICLDAEPGVEHRMATMPDNRHDIPEADKLLHCDEQDVFADSGCRGIEKRPERQGQKFNRCIEMMPGKTKLFGKKGS